MNFRAKQTVVKHCSKKRNARFIYTFHFLGPFLGRRKKNGHLQRKQATEMKKKQKQA
jgi:transcriptional regulatory protein LevR